MSSITNTKAFLSHKDAEQDRNEGTRTYSPEASYTEAIDKYRPLPNNPSFEIPSFVLPISEVNVYTANPDIKIAAFFLTKDKVVFCVHPQILDAQKFPSKLKEKFEKPPFQLSVTPTASTRSVVVMNHEDMPSFGMKLHFPFKISRFQRRVTDAHVKLGISCTKEVQRGIDENKLPPRFALIRDTIGISLKKFPEDDCSAGFLVREMTPYPYTKDSREIIPGFALYGNCLTNPKKLPYIVELIEMLGEKDPKKFTLENIYFPIIQAFIEGYKNLGVLFELHGQNTLIEYDKETGRPTRIVMRDSTSLCIDKNQRKRLGLSSDQFSYGLIEDPELVKHKLSQRYDYFMGHHFFEYLATTLEKHFKIPKNEIYQACKDEFKRLFPEHEQYMPKTVYEFSDKRDPVTGSPVLTDSKKAPLWRP
ncbi:MAG: hypothetical protein K1060chlam5_00837 [Candidatus Anoxychlamydiales bacterium]|nr:hypothetical protein [Candidatus Anoxychlamydiales bacterium]